MRKNIYIFGFQERLDEAVRDSGKTKARIAEMIGCDRKCLINSYDNKMLSSGYLARFCSITGVSADWLPGLSKKKRGD